MADTDIQSDPEDSGRRASAAARRAGGGAADAAGEAVQTGLEAERRSFSDALDTAKSAIGASRDMARTSQETVRRAGDHAADLWRASMAPMTLFQTEIGQWFDHLWRQASPTRLPPFAGMLAPFAGLPPADMKMTDKALELHVELPGLKAADVQLTLVGDTLVVSGDRRDEVNGNRGGLRFSERRFGHFERTFPLPPEADHGKIDASFSDGLLKVTIARSAAAAEPKAIPIKG